MIGMHQIRCKNYDCSSVNSHLGRRSAGSCQIRLTTFSPSLARKDMLPWIAGCPLILQTKNDAGKFLTYLESTLDDEISPHVRVYELEDVKKRADETIDTIIDCICQLAYCALIGDASDAAVQFEVQHRLIHAIPDSGIELQKELLKVSWDKGVSHLLEICCTYYAIEYGAAAMCAGITINVIQKLHQPQKQPQKHSSQYQYWTHQHPPWHDICPAWESVWKGCLKKGYWQAKCHSSEKNQSTAPRYGQSKGMPGQYGKKGKKADLIGVYTDEPHVMRFS